MKKIKARNLTGFFVVFVILAAFFILKSGLVLAADNLNSDADGLADADELDIYHTDPNNADTDGDGYSDYEEVYNGYSPRDKNKIKLSRLDSDSDGVPDSWEIRLGLDLLNPDSDGDSYADGVEITNGYDPNSSQPQKLAKEIKVDLKTQTLSYYFNDTELEKFLISSGIKSMPTPTGQFTILDKVPVKNYGGPGFNFYLPNTKWNLHFTTGKYRYYIHGAYWHHNFGHPMSHGCVNVAYGNMERLYNFAQVGTKV
ncbi:MAG: L,D-transpeptidase family protein, partial [Patescibacteria group bacterium]